MLNRKSHKRERERRKVIEENEKNQIDSFVISVKNCFALILSLQKRPDTGKNHIPRRISNDCSKTWLESRSKKSTAQLIE